MTIDPGMALTNDLLDIIDHHQGCPGCPLGCTCTYCSEFLGVGETCTTPAAVKAAEQFVALNPRIEA